MITDKWFRTHPDIVDRAEEKTLVKFFHGQLLGKPYSDGHWDSVIFRYREALTMLDELPADVRPLVERLIALFEPGARVQPRVHAIDLSDRGGLINGHVDSVKFCGDHVIGLSLLSPAVMRLRRAAADRVHAGTEALAGYARDGEADPWEPAEGSGEPGEEVDVLLPRRTAYVMHGVGRFGFEHSVLGGTATFAPTGEAVTRRRRISVLVRDEPRPELGVD